jgi:hypothetical protein
LNGPEKVVPEVKVEYKRFKESQLSEWLKYIDSEAGGSNRLT